MHGSIVTSYMGKETTVCPDVTATMTELETATVEALSCYPTYGSLDVEEYFKYCEFSDEQLRKACQPDQYMSTSFVQCWPPIKDESQPLPEIDSTFEVNFLMNYGTPGCDDVFRNWWGHWLDPSDAALQVDALCLPVLREIVNKCTWNGGQASNKCGTFKFQSCVKGIGCQWGNPGFNG